MEDKILEETAVEEFDSFLDNNEIEFDDSEEKTKKQIIKLIQKGRVCFDGEKIIYTISKFSENFSGDKIEINRPKGKDWLNSD
ncbi:MAG: hypothetical protein ACRC4W_02500, partial [Treponemataceae bacterium]